MAGIERCPLCGIGAPTELDHFLPRSRYKPLATYVRNLVPVCHECNHAKLQYVPTGGSPRLLHAYLEPLPDVRFLRAAVTLGVRSVSVRYEADAGSGLSEETLARLQHQLELLRLTDRYDREVSTYLASQATGLKLAFDAGGSPKVKWYLETQAASDFQRFHANHWSGVLLLELSTLAGFCDGGFLKIFSANDMAQAPPC